MLLGMAASYFNRLIIERRAKIEELRKKGVFAKPNIDFDVWEFVQPFFVSLITFGAVIGKLNANDNWINIIIGFETGFFWQTILSSRAQVNSQVAPTDQGNHQRPSEEASQ
jgi:hypothetical protein